MLSQIKNSHWYTATSLLLLAYLCWIFSSIVIYVIIAFVISLIASPISKLLSKIKIGKFQLNSSIKAFISLLVIWGIILSAISVFIPIIANEIEVFSSFNINRVEIVFKEPINFIEKTFYQVNTEGTDFNTYISNKLRLILNPEFFQSIFSTFSSIIGNVFMGFFAISFIAFFFIKDEKLFYRSILLIVPDKYDNKIKHAMLSIQQLLTRYFIGLFIDVFIISTLITIGLLIVGIEFQHAIVIGLFAGMLNIIPYVGPIIAVSFGLILSIAINLNLELNQIIPIIGFVALVFLIVQLLDGIIIQPIIYSNSVKAHPLEIFLVIISAGSVAGIAGMILAVPSYTVLRIFAATFFKQFKVVDSLTKNM
jgi:predicted PurR-regulated permease PerM